MGKTEELLAPANETLIEKFAKTLEQWKGVKSGTHDIPIELIREWSKNPRTLFDATDLAGLAESIRVDGLIQAVSVRAVPPDADGHCFELMGGARRLRACQMLACATIRAEIMPADDVAALRKSLVENLQRENLNPVDASRGLQMLLDTGAYKSVKEMALALGKSERPIYQLLELKGLIAPVEDALLNARITLSHAALICRENSTNQMKALKACFKPEQIFNGESYETHEALVTEKALRQWIKDNLREEEPQLPGVAPTAEEALEEAGDKLLDDAAAVEGTAAESEGQAAEDEPEVDRLKSEDADDAPSATEDSPQDRDEPAAPPSPNADSSEYLEEEARRLALFNAIVAKNKAMLMPQLRLVACRLMLGLDKKSAERILAVLAPAPSTILGIPEYMATLTKFTDTDRFAQLVVALALVREVSPNVEEDTGLKHMALALGLDEEGKAVETGIPTSFTDDEIDEAVFEALTAVSGANERWNARSNVGLNDKDLMIQIERELATTGGGSTPQGHAFGYTKREVRITHKASNKVAHMVKGKELIERARRVFEVGAPKSSAKKAAAKKPESKPKAKAKPAKASKKKK